MGLKEIIDEINQSADQQSDSVVNESKVKATRLLMTKSEELDKLYSKKEEVLSIELARLKKKLTAKAELSASRTKYRMESNLVESVLDESFEQMITFFKEDHKKYVTFIVGLIADSAKFLSVDMLSIALNIDDEKLFADIKKKSKIKLSLSPSAKIRGGVICSSDNVFVDNSLSAIFKDMRPKFVQYILGELQKL